MKRDERKRRFNEAIVNLLYPSPQQDESVEPLIRGSSTISDVISGSISNTIRQRSQKLEDSENGSPSGNVDEEGSDDYVGMGKLTRAQRKRTRKKKLKEEAIHRGKLIGPLMPPKPAEDAPPAVRSNASETAACKKMKQRRMAKRLAKENRIASSALEKYDDQDHKVCK